MDPEPAVLALTRLRVFLKERGIKEVFKALYDPNRRRLKPREL